MPFESDGFDTLCSRADGFYTDSRFADAALLFERALKVTGGTKEERFWAKNLLGVCLKVLGRYTEALAYSGEVYSEAKDSEHHENAIYSLINQIECFRYLQESQETETHFNLSRRKELIEEGLLWLRDIDREMWRHGLLSELAWVLDSLGEEEKALDVAEEAYRLRKRVGYPGWVLSDYAVQVARLALNIGNYERSLQVLDEIEESDLSPYEPWNVLNERVRVLRAMLPSKLSEAMDAARRAAQLADEMQYPRSRLYTYQELADIAILVQSFAEAHDALCVVREVAFGDETLDRTYLLRRARYHFRRARDALSGGDDETARELYQMLAEWLSEIEDALEALEE